MSTTIIHRAFANSGKGHANIDDDDFLNSLEFFLEFYKQHLNIPLNVQLQHFELCKSVHVNDISPMIKCAKKSSERICVHDIPAEMGKFQDLTKTKLTFQMLKQIITEMRQISTKNSFELSS